MPPPLPTRLGPYEIRARLGKGGMGEVYLAEDTRLKRQVAIKILATDATDAGSDRRLVREAQAAAALDHPHICAIYEVGEHDGRAFIVMQYVEGETLAVRIQRARPTVSDALDMAISIADGLAEAHARGIIHRDVKPQNIMVTARGQAKILDFGLAKATAQAQPEVETQTLLTQAGAIVGTAPYMSPEQVKGQVLDARSDIFSFGAVLYEVLTGHCPFRAPTTAETISAVLTSDPPPLAAHGVVAPASLERVLRQCLKKNPEQRYQSMREVRLELESVRRELESGPIAGAAATAARVSGEDIASTATSVNVARRRTALSAGVGVLAVTLGWYAWYSGGPSGSAPARGAQAMNSPAYDLYLRGKVNVDSENPDNNDTAIRLLGEAIAADPGFAPAHAELARAYSIKAFYFAPEAERKALYEDARVALEKALRLDPTLAEAHLARGLLLWTHANRFPHDQAAQSYKRAIELNPTLDEAHHQLALVYLHVGLLDKAWAHIEQALAVNPANTLARVRFGVIDLYRGRHESALAIFDSSPPEINRSIVAFQRAASLLQLGRISEATSLVDDYLAKYSTDEGGTVTSVKAMLLAKAGQARDAQVFVQRAIELGQNFGHFHHTAYNIASAYALLGRPDDAMRWLQTAAEDGFPCYPLFEQDVNLNSLRGDPRFVTFLAQMKTRMERYATTL